MLAYLILVLIIIHIRNKSLNVLFKDDVNVLMKKSDYDVEIIPNVDLNNKMSAPISKGNVIGKISYDVLRY